METLPFDMAFYKPTKRVFTAPLDPVFPLNLKRHVDMPPDGEFRSLAIDRLYIYYHQGKAIEHSFPASQGSFNRIVLSDPLGPLSANIGVSEKAVYFVGGCAFDPEMVTVKDLAYGMYLRLRYDPTGGLIDGSVELLHSPFSEPSAPSPVAKFMIGYTLRYTLPDDI